MDFGKLASLSVGLAAFLGGLWIVLQIIKSVRRSNGGSSSKAGERSTEEWEGRMRKMHEDSNKQLMDDIRNVLDARNERIRSIVREELRAARGRGN